MQPGQFGGLDDLGVGGVFAAVADVFADGAVKRMKLALPCSNRLRKFKSVLIGSDSVPAYSRNVTSVAALKLPPVMNSEPKMTTSVVNSCG